MHRVLVIDDEQSIRKALELGLSSKTIAVHSVPGGMDGIRLGCGIHYDVLIVDLHLPDIHGIQVIQQIKKCNPSATFIVITGYLNGENRSEVERIGVNDYLEKPLDLGLLTQAVHRGLGEHKPFNNQ